MTPEISPEIIAALEIRLLDLIDSIGAEKLSENIRELEEQASVPGFWDDRNSAENTVGELALKKRLMIELEYLKSGMSDLRTLWQLQQEAGDQQYLDELAAELKQLTSRIDKLHVAQLLSGEFDERSAVLNIRSGAGGDDATDFAEMLMRMYLRYADLTGLKSTVLEVSKAEGAGVKSASIKFEGQYAYGRLSVEAGTHRLVRMSPFNSAGKRQTSFAAVEVVPLVEEQDSLEIPDKDIRVDVFRSSGPGGQSVNTTDSAVRITHLPTGIIVSCQNEKSQLQNKLEAMRVLQSRLLDLRRQEEDAKKRQMVGEVKASWGEQMRSYVLAPYQMVKDLRTLHEDNNPDDVFSGKLDGFISAGIRWRAQQNR